MNLQPIKSSTKKYSAEVSSFGGLNTTSTAKAGDLRACTNMSTDETPFLTPRNDRTTSYDLLSGTAMYVYNGIVYVDGTTLYYNGEAVGTVLEGVKQFTVMNTKLVIWPDKMYLDLTTKDFRHLDVKATKVSATATFTTNSIQMEISTKTGTGFAGFSSSTDDQYVMTYSELTWDTGSGWTKTVAAEKRLVDVGVGDLLIPQGSGNLLSINMRYTNHPYAEDNTVGKYYVVTAIEPGIEYHYRWSKYTTYRPDNLHLARDQFVGYVYGVNANDYPYGDFRPDENSIYYWYGDRIDYLLYGLTNISYDIRTAHNSSLLALFNVGDRVKVSGCTTISANNNDEWQVIDGVTMDTITFKNTPFTAGTESGTVVIERSTPDMELICANDNRLWGVKDQIIYASALGDPSSFYQFDNNDTDSYQAPVDTADNFTAVVSYDQHIYLHKENMVYKIYGDYPSTYQYQKYDIPGVQSGCHKSAQIINEILYYKARDGIYAYSGGQPSLISLPLGINRHTNAVAGATSTKYYLSMMNSAGTYELFVFDTIFKKWTKEDDTHVIDFAFYSGKMYILDSSTSYIQMIDLSTADTVPWSVDLVPFTENTLNHKVYQRLAVRYEMGQGSVFNVAVAFDGSNEYVDAAHITDSGQTVATIPISGYCDSMSVRLYGTGKVIIKSLHREFILVGV